VFDPETTDLTTNVLAPCRVRGFPGDRTEIRRAAIVLALELLRAESRG